MLSSRALRPFHGRKNNYLVASTTARELVVEFVAIGCTRAFGCPAPITGLKKPPKLPQCPQENSRNTLVLLARIRPDQSAS